MKFYRLFTLVDGEIHVEDDNSNVIWAAIGRLPAWVEYEVRDPLDRVLEEFAA